MSSILRRAFARPGVTVAGAVFAAVMTGIVTNAVLFQKGHHPSPLLGTGAVAESPPVPLPPRPVRQTAEAAPAAVAPGMDLAPAAPAMQSAGPAPHAVTAPPVRKVAARPDPIRSLLGQDNVSSAHPSPASKATEAAKHAPELGTGRQKAVTHAVAGRAVLRPTDAVAGVKASAQR